MGLNETPSSERIHIGFFGRRNAGKSSLVNAVTGQDLVIVSDVKGTTTDPVQKAMELLPLGPVLIIDTPGIDDEGELGSLRVRKAKQVLNKIDVAVLAVDALEGLKSPDEELIQIFREKEVPYIIVWNKCDLLKEIPQAGSAGGSPAAASAASGGEIYVSALLKTNITELKELIGRSVPSNENTMRIVGDLLSGGDFAVL